MDSDTQHSDSVIHAIAFILKLLVIVYIYLPYTAHLIFVLFTVLHFIGVAFIFILFIYSPPPIEGKAFRQ